MNENLDLEEIKNLHDQLFALIKAQSDPTSLTIAMTEALVMLLGFWVSCGKMDLDSYMDLIRNGVENSPLVKGITEAGGDPDTFFKSEQLRHLTRDAQSKERWN